MAARQNLGFSPNMCEWLQDCIYVLSIPLILQAENHAGKKESHRLGTSRRGMVEYRGRKWPELLFL